jgi:hypothetical protein
MTESEMDKLRIELNELKIAVSRLERWIANKEYVELKEKKAREEMFISQKKQLEREGQKPKVFVPEKEEGEEK